MPSVKEDDCPSTIEKDRSSVKSISCALLLVPPNKLLDNMLGGRREGQCARVARSEGPWSLRSVSLALNSTTTIITIVSATPTAKGKQRRKGLPRLGQASDQGCAG